MNNPNNNEDFDIDDFDDIFDELLNEQTDFEEALCDALDEIDDL